MDYRKVDFFHHGVFCQGIDCFFLWNFLMHLCAHVATVSSFIQIQCKVMDFEGIFFVCLGFCLFFCPPFFFKGCGFVGCFSGFFPFFFLISRTSWRQKPLAC